MEHNAYPEYEYYDAPPDHWKRVRDAMRAVSRMVPVPAGAEEIESTPAVRPNTIIGPDGGLVSFYTQDTPSLYFATVDHELGYAEFIRRDGQWKYLSAVRVMLEGLRSDYFDPVDARDISCEPPTIAMAFEQWAELCDSNAV